MTSQIKNLFPTEVMFGHFDYDIINNATQELLTNVNFMSGGDLSQINLLDQDGLPEFKKFIKNHAIPKFVEYTQLVFDYQLELDKCKFKSWTVNGAGHYSLGFHNHSCATLSAVFYMLTENTQTQGGVVRFHDPRFNANRGMLAPFASKHKDYEFLPKSGDFLIFPSYLYHSVSTFHGNLRLIVPVDMYKSII
jgi:hypothetical protein